MPSSPPVVGWYTYHPQSAEPWEAETLWDAGIVEAGSVSQKKEFYVWNNLNGAEAVADMINVRISVKDENGTDEDKSICGQNSDPGKQARVRCQYKNSALFAWGFYNTNTNVFDYDSGLPTDPFSPGDIKYAELTSDPVPITAETPISPISATGGTVSGAANVGSVSDNKQNYIHLALQLYAEGTANAGQIRWLTRISYQYT